MRKCKHAILSLVFIAGVGLGAPAQAALIGANLGITDVGAPSPFSFSILTPIAPLTGPVSWSASVSGTLTDATGDGISAAPNGASIFEFIVGGTVVGTDSLGTVTSSFADAYSGVFDCGVLGCATLALDIHFLGSGNGDVYNMQSTFTVVSASQNVPEPGMLALLAIGLAGLGFSRRRL